MAIIPDQAALHRGAVRESFDVVQGVQLLSYRAGQVVHVDAFTRAAMEAAGGDVHWTDREVVPGMAFIRPSSPLRVEGMRHGLIYVDDALDAAEAKAAHRAGRIARVTVQAEGAEPARGWVLTR